MALRTKKKNSIEHNDTLDIMSHEKDTFLKSPEPNMQVVPSFSSPDITSDPVFNDLMSPMMFQSHLLLNRKSRKNTNI